MRRHARSVASSAARGTPIAFLVASLIAVAGLGVPLRDGQARAAVRNPEDLLIVDCLLPGQIRKLGRQSTFMSARRPVRTTQADCEIRGGEYVSYDRADYRTALQVWLAQAELGDAEAQNYVGEIYAKGLGTAPDYGKAAAWYEKAVAQGNKRAMINLGYLYEEGLGVTRDLARALNLYRQGAGVKDELLFASAVAAHQEAQQARIGELEATVARQEEEAARLRARLESLEHEAAQRRGALERARSELHAARRDLIAKQKELAAPAQSQQLDSAAAALAAKERQLAEERAAFERDKATHAAQVKADRIRLAELRSEEQTLSRRVAASAGPEAEALRRDLDRVRSAAAELALALDGAMTRMSDLESKLAANDARLAEEAARFEAERKKLQAALAASQQDRELLLLLEQKLAEKQREVGRQREQIVALESRIVGGDAPGGGSPGTAIAANAGPLLEILEPAITVARGRPAAMVRPVGGSAEIVGKVLARAGVGTVDVNGQKVAVGDDGVFRATVPASAEGSAVRVAAVDRSGARAALEFLLVSAPGGSARAVTAGSPAAAVRGVPRGVSLGRYHAVVIGNDRYAAYPRLSSAVSDARKVADVLRQRYGFSVRLLEDASRFEILSALNDMRESLGSEDNLLVYFAGHGELDGNTKQGYWLPVDAGANQPGTWISNRAISDILNTMQAKHVMVVADSCYSGAMTRASVPVFPAAADAGRWAEWVRSTAASRSRTALTSGGLAPVPDASGGGNSLFAKAFVAALEDNNQLLEAQRLFRGVSASLALAATESTLIQVPEYAPIQFAGHEAGEFFFFPRAGGGGRAGGAP